MYNWWRFFPWTQLSDSETKNLALKKLSEFKSKFIDEKFRLILREEFEETIDEIIEIEIGDLVEVKSGISKGKRGVVTEKNLVSLLNTFEFKIHFGGTWYGYEKAENLIIINKL